MDLQAFFKMSYGLYVVSSSDREHRSGCVVNTLTQVTAEPPKLMVAVNKDNFTTGIIRKAGYFAGTAFGVGADMLQIGHFGFKSGRDFDKFADIPFAVDENGMPYPTAHMVARFSCKVVQELDVGTHILFVGEVTGAEKMAGEEPMTYAYYHQVKKGKTPKNASSYQPEAPKVKGWRCTVCGYEYQGAELPEGFTCPICGVDAGRFEKIE